MSKKSKPEPLFDTGGVRLKFGPYKGELLTRVPPNYLDHLVNRGDERELVLRSGEKFPAYIIAGSEIVRRGFRIKNSDVSGHAIDRISQGHLKIWKRTKEGGEGLFTWAQRMSLEALKVYASHPESCDKQSNAVVIPFSNMRWVIDIDHVIPVLLTVMELEKRKAEKSRKQKDRNRRKEERNRAEREASD